MHWRVSVCVQILFACVAGVSSSDVSWKEKQQENKESLKSVEPDGNSVGRDGNSVSRSLANQKPLMRKVQRHSHDDNYRRARAPINSDEPGQMLKNKDAVGMGAPFRFYGHSVETLLEVKDTGFTLIPPSKEPYNLKSPNAKSYSEVRQDLILQPILQKLGKGFFVESGAMDGEGASNTLFYEKLGWTGLLIEPQPQWTKGIINKHRKSYFFKGCLSPTSHEQTLQFTDKRADGRPCAARCHLSDSGKLQVLAEPLQDLLRSIGRSTVDFWSLDIEGSEAVVLKATDFSQVEVGVLLIEMNKDEANNAAIKEIMDKEGFHDIGHTIDRDGKSSLDQIFVNPKYFAARGLAVPTGADLPPQNRNS